MKRKIEPYQPDYKNNHLQVINDAFLSEIVRSAKHAKDLNAEIIELRKIIDGNYMYISSLENEIKENNLIIRLFEESTDGDSPDLEKIAEIKDKHLAWRLSCVDFEDFG
ncbi:MULTISPECIES: hypothetical protein [Pseudomonas]|uniref:Uncharacterized protein n=1 Tax=Pseudomonas cremoris TaxID=2724178 RepID=A0A7X1DZM9_9PSED|nr:MULTISPECIES: hypothetical protein [Pseudomonas]MBC2407617.1 hypothetical protein [Pseudomonas cremoris]MQU59602.1 hypothetical protein [Pseudomonas helleri]